MTAADRRAPAASARRLRRFDLVLAAVVGVGAAGSAVGVLSWEEPSEPVLAFDVAWDLDRERSELPSRSHAGSGTLEIPFDVARANLTGVIVEARVRAEGPRLEGEVIRAELRPPGLEPVSRDVRLLPGTATTATIPLTALVAKIPNVDRVEGPSEAVAAAELAARHASTSGRGTWVLAVNFSAPARLAPTPEPHSVSAVVETEAYRARLSLGVPAVGG